MKKCSGILTPIFSLPSEYGIGTFGEEAVKFASFLSKTGQKYWQLLPLNPTSYGDSPYQSFSTFALNPYFIDLDILIQKGFLDVEDVSPLKSPYSRYVDYAKEYNVRFPILRKAFDNSKKHLGAKFASFEKENSFWLSDYALFMTIKKINGDKSWMDWDQKYRLREEEALEEVKRQHQDDILFWKWIQYQAHEQFLHLKKIINHLGIKIVGDIPIYTALDSADVWSNPSLFQLDENRRPTLVAGVPPDYFSSTGQLWGNPIYNYSAMEKDGFYWWKQRVYQCQKLYDVLRIDHFRGMASYWAVPYQDTTAEHGHWVDGPKMKLVNAIKQAGGNMNIIAEDLGFLTQEVLTLKKEAGWPGMAIMEFGFDANDVDFKNNFIPENFKPDCVSYIGTHDNDTLVGFLSSQKQLWKSVEDYLHYDFKNKKQKKYEFVPLDNTDIVKDTVKKLMKRMMVSKSDLTIFTMQDFLFEGEGFRINTPGTMGDNWKYRLPNDYDSKKTASLIRSLTKLREKN